MLLETAERRAFLLADGWKIRASKDEDGEIIVTIDTERSYGASADALRALGPPIPRPHMDTAI